MVQKIKNFFQKYFDKKPIITLLITMYFGYLFFKMLCILYNKLKK